MSKTGFTEDFTNTPAYFGDTPEETLTAWQHRITKDFPVLDVGAGQGRNAIFLARQGFRVHAIDPDERTMRVLADHAAGHDLPLTTEATAFQAYVTEEVFSAMLCFGLIPILTLDEIAALRQLADRALTSKSILFVTVFTVGDPAYPKHSGEWKTIGKNSFLSPEGSIRTYFEPGELQTCFEDYEILQYREYLGPAHCHAEGPLHRHHWAEGVFQHKTLKSEERTA